MSRPQRAVCVALLSVGAWTARALGDRQPATVTSAEISPVDLKSRLFRIADDSMQGRAVGSRGDFQTTAYIASEYQRLGLEPAGDSGTWFQTVPFWIAVPDAQSTVATATKTFHVGHDFLPTNVRAMERTLNGSQVVYGGVLGDPSTWISAQDAAGKTVVLDLANAILTLWITRELRNALFENRVAPLTTGTFGARIDAHFLVSSVPARYPARNVVGVLRGSDPLLRNEYVALSAHNDHVGLDHAPADHDSLRAFNRVVRPMGADSPLRTPTPTEWTSIHHLLDSLRHVHRPRLDSIRNGADDDGSGTVALLEIAESMASRAVRPRRSMLFVSHTGEEAGLVGSRWFTDHPSVPLDAIAVEIDQDATGRGTADEFPKTQGSGRGGATYLEVVGARRLSREFGDSLEAVNARTQAPFVFDYTYDTPGHPSRYYCRADHYRYARVGIPSVTISRGEHLDYHQVTDEAQYISYVDLARVTKFVHNAAVSIANMSRRPRLDTPRLTSPSAFCQQ